MGWMAVDDSSAIQSRPEKCWWWVAGKRIAEIAASSLTPNYDDLIAIM
jgi:hypothetical protein